jgi:hypothetical protein
MVADGKVMLKIIVKSSHYMKNSIHRHTPSQKRDVSHMLSLITKKMGEHAYASLYTPKGDAPYSTCVSDDELAKAKK